MFRLAMAYRLAIYHPFVDDYLDRSLLHGSVETLVLALLAEGDGYGYQMRKDLASRSHHCFQLSFGRLYPLLRSMQRRGLVTSAWGKTSKSRDGKHYSLTAKGRQELLDRKRRWQQFSTAMDRVLFQSQKTK